MKKQCLNCQTYFFGRTDKQFCSITCKNSYHNLHRKDDLAYTVDHSLHLNRSILHQLVPAEISKMTWERTVLEKLGFKFDVMTGIVFSAEGKIKRKVYEYVWDEGSNDNIIVERHSKNGS